MAGLLQASPAPARRHNAYSGEAPLDWSQCLAAESIPGKVGGAWVFRGTRMPIQTVFENPEAGMSVDEITEVFDVTPEEVKAVPHFASPSLAKAPAFG